MFLLAGLLGLAAIGSVALAIDMPVSEEEDEAADVDTTGDGPTGPEPNDLHSDPAPTIRTDGGTSGSTATDEHLVLSGDAGTNALDGGSGNDQINGYLGDDVIRGGDGRDDLHGAEGADKLFGERGDDTLHGHDGADQLFGGDGHDRLFGHDGDDVLSGGSGQDDLSGPFRRVEHPQDADDRQERGQKPARLCHAYWATSASRASLASDHMPRSL